MTAMHTYLFVYFAHMQAAFIESTIETEFNITEDQINNTDTKELCRFVAYYHLVEAVDNGSNIHYYLKQNALDAVEYWVSAPTIAVVSLLFAYSQYTQ